jgi:saccharopine dehydrogenase (NAD+, L-lysine-forming)
MKICLRAETKPFEKRRALSPIDCQKLIEQGHEIIAEDCEQSIFNAEDYLSAGAKIAPKGSWTSLDKDWIILGLKELPESNDPLIHDHIFFAHAFKGQEGWRDILNRFNHGGGRLYDLEYLQDENNRRVAAFGYWAGYAGAAMSWALFWHHQDKGHLNQFKIPFDFKNVDVMHHYLSQTFKSPHKLEAIVVGARGRSGKGASDFFIRQNDHVTPWDKAETAVGGPFAEILNYDIFINCVLMTSENPPFLNRETIAKDHRLKIIGDVSCDPTGPYNSLPIYNRATTFDDPVIAVEGSKNDLYVMAIDHLPSMLPKESSEDFSSQLLPHLMDMKTNVWSKALDTFNHFRSKASD